LRSCTSASVEVEAAWLVGPELTAPLWGGAASSTVEGWAQSKMAEAAIQARATNVPNLT
jgi:hypothetical protein